MCGVWGREERGTVGFGEARERAAVGWWAVGAVIALGGGR